MYRKNGEELEVHKETFPPLSTTFHTVLEHSINVSSSHEIEDFLDKDYF